MIELITNHFGKAVDIYTFSGQPKDITELNIPVNYIVFQDQVYFTSDSVSTDPRVALFIKKE